MFGVGAVAPAVDWIDRLTASWAESYPESDTSAIIPMARLSRLSLLLGAFQREVLEPFGLTPSDYSVLAALRRSGNRHQLTPSDLYNVLERSSGGITKMLKRLEKLGLVERFRDPDDRRSNFVGLTAEGREVEKQAFEAFLVSTRTILEPLPRARLKELDLLLEQLLGCFEDHFYR